MFTWSSTWMHWWFLSEVLKILVEEHSYLLPLKKSCALVSDLQSEVCCSLCQIYVWCLSKGCVLPVLLEIKSSTSRLLNFTHSSHSALIEMLNLPLQVINYQLKSSCPIKENIKTPDTCIIYDLHQNLTKLFPFLPKAIFFTIIFPFISNSWPSRQNCVTTFRDCCAL